MTDTKKKMSIGKKIAFGMGDFGGNFCFSFLSSFAMIYFTDIAGANPGAIATLLLLAKCFDGITDFIMGNLIDKTHSKMGKARPWLFWSAFPLALALIMLFNVPSGLSGIGKNIYIFIFYVLVCAFFYTANNISYNALTSLVTDNSEDRVSMGSIRFMLTAVAGIIIGSFTTILVEAFGNGQKGWTAVSILYAFIFLISTLITVFGLKEINHSADREDQVVKDSPKLVDSIRILLTNKYFIMIFVIFTTMYIFTGATGSAGIYFATYLLGNANIYGLLSIAMMIPMFLSLIFAPAITKKLGMQKMGIVSGLLFIAGSVITCLAQTNIPGLMVGIVIRSLGMGPISALLFTLVAEVNDNITLKTGKNIEGMTYSCSSIGIKIGTGLGTAIVGWLLSMGKYVGGAETQIPEALRMISLSYLGIPLVVGIIMVIMFLFMDVEKNNEGYRKHD